MAQEPILVVEDEANIVEALSYILQRAGFTVEVATDGVAALDRLRRERFGAVVLDLMIPRMNGFELLKAVREDHALADLPVLVLTAKGQAKDRQTAEEIGASAFITKPFSNAEVVERLREFTGPERG